MLGRKGIHVHRIKFNNAGYNDSSSQCNLNSVTACVPDCTERTRERKLIGNERKCEECCVCACKAM